jgi:hypothetical protein
MPSVADVINKYRRWLPHTTAVEAIDVPPRHRLAITGCRAAIIAIAPAAEPCADPEPAAVPPPATAGSTHCKSMLSGLDFPRTPLSRRHSILMHENKANPTSPHPAAPAQDQDVAAIHPHPPPPPPPPRLSLADLGSARRALAAGGGDRMLRLEVCNCRDAVMPQPLGGGSGVGGEAVALRPLDRPSPDTPKPPTASGASRSSCDPACDLARASGARRWGEAPGRPARSRSPRGCGPVNGLSVGEEAGAEGVGRPRSSGPGALLPPLRIGAEGEAGAGVRGLADALLRGLQSASARGAGAREPGPVVLEYSLAGDAARLGVEARGRTYALWAGPFRAVEERAARGLVEGVAGQAVHGAGAGGDRGGGGGRSAGRGFGERLVAVLGRVAGESERPRRAARAQQEGGGLDFCVVRVDDGGAREIPQHKTERCGDDENKDIGDD